MVLSAGCAGNTPKTDTDKAAEGVGQGYRGVIHVLVRSNSRGIQEIEVLEHEEDEFIGGAAIESLIEAVLDADSPDVDAVSGATTSSEGFLEAVRNALGAGD